MLELANRPCSVLHVRVTKNPRTGTSVALRNDRRKISHIIPMVLLIPELRPGGQRLTCGPTLSTNQMRPWDWLGAPDCLHVPIQPGNRHQLFFFSALLARRQ